MSVAKKRINGREYWYLRVTVNGRRFERSIGLVDSISETEAALTAERMVAAINAKAPGKTDGPADGKLLPTFREVVPVAMADIAAVKRWKNAGSERQWLQTLNDYALPVLGDKRIAEIDTDDVLAALRPIWTEKPETASRLRSRIEAVLAWAIVKKLRPGNNPAAWKNNLSLFLPSPEKVKPVIHHEAPTLAELKKVTAYCLAHPSPVSGVLLWIIATASRVTEARGLCAGEIKNAIWTVPPERLKSTAAGAHRVPVSELAEAALAMGEKKGLVFRAPNNRDMVALDSPRLKLLGIVKRPVTAHGIRSTFRDWCARKKIPDAVAEKCLAHVWGNAVTVAYYREDLLEQRRTVMERWARDLTPKT